jgi:DNA-binding transcriptional LysR family regulator
MTGWKGAGWRLPRGLLDTLYPEEGTMDRIDAMKVFVTALDEGSLAAAGRKLGRSQAAVSRAMAYLEGRAGVPLLHRSTRASKLSDVGGRYADICRRLLTALDEADTLVASAKSVPSGTLALSAPVLTGEEVLRPIVDNFLDAFPMISAKLFLLDRPVNLIDEGVDAALRIGNLPDSSMVAVRVGEVREVIVASPSYLREHPSIETPGDLACQRIVTFSHAGLDSWTFPRPVGSTIPRSVPITPRFVVNSARAAIASAVEGRGVTRLCSYQVADLVRSGQLEIVLKSHNHTALPVHLIMPEGRISVPKVRAFVDFVVPRLRLQFARLSVDVRD